MTYREPPTLDDVTATPIRDAATVVLLRDSPAGPEVWLMTRRSTMSFAAGMSAFPGGRVDPADATLPFSTGSEAHLEASARRAAVSLDTHRGIVGAALRETFEETGVLFTCPTADLRVHRAEIEARRTDFAALLREHNLTLDATALTPWARWITPVGEARRYDTRFFTAVLPDGASVENLTSEAVKGEWLRPALALEQAERQQRLFLPPTLITLRDLSRHPSTAHIQAAAAQQRLDPIRPTLRHAADHRVVDIPELNLTLPMPL